MSSLTGAPKPAGGPRRIDYGPDLVVLRADNAGPMTLDGTRSYVLGRGPRVLLVDPGPPGPAQLELLASAVGGRRVVRILLTHAHADHSGAAAPE